MKQTLPFIHTLLQLPISHCQSWNTQLVDSALPASTGLALALDNDRDQGVRFGNNPALARSCVDMFLAKLRTNFPMIVVNDTMTNFGLLGYHPRGEWDGDYPDFNARQQAINVNGHVSVLIFSRRLANITN
jgi:hypothetical protein